MSYRMIWVIVLLGPIICWALMRPAIGFDGQVASNYIQPNDFYSKPAPRAPKPIKQAPGGSNVVVRSDVPIRENWTLNPAMSKACTQGLFRQSVQHHLIGVFQNKVYGAAVGGHSSLVDRLELAKPQVVYVFKGQGTTSCRVFHRNS